MDNLETTKITYAKNLSAVSFNVMLSATIDSNVNIKNILDISTYLFDEKIECMNGKFMLNGKIGLKLLYIDTDGVYNTLNEIQNFSETFSESSISTDSVLTLNNVSIQNEILSTDRTLKLNCEISVEPTLYLNLPIKTNLNYDDNLITKKSELKTSFICCRINSEFDYTCTIETKDPLSKILCCNAYFTPTNLISKENAIEVEGKLKTDVLYELNVDGTSSIKEIYDTFNIKTDIKLDDLKDGDIVDLKFTLDKSCNRISIDQDEDSNTIVIENKIKINGIGIRNMIIDVIDDAYSTEKEVESTTSSRDYVSNIVQINEYDSIYGEVSLTDNETAIDEILSNLNICPEVTNTYLKDSRIVVEGVISSCLTYLDENKEYKQKFIQIPFVLNTKQTADSFTCHSSKICIEDYKCKVKRGTIIELEYNFKACINLYQKNTIQIITDVKMGKSLDFSNLDYQIYIAKPNESMWELCKRTKCTLEDVLSQNKDLPNIFIGGERIIIKR